MKMNAIIRIILYSAVILILLGILLGGIVWKQFSHVRWNESHTWSDTSDDTSRNSTAAGTVASQIQDISVEWASGTITIQPGAVDQITYEESHVSKNKYKMVTKESGRELEIRYCKESSLFPGIGKNIDFSKNLLITVPEGYMLNSLEIDAAAAEVIIRGISINEMDFDGASGTCTFEGCSIVDLDIDTASGDINYEGTLERLDFDAASASFRGKLSTMPRQIDMDSMSGDLELTLPDNTGFSVSMDAMSSTFFSDFPTTIQNGIYIYGDGSCRIQVDAMSGDVSIYKSK